MVVSRVSELLVNASEIVARNLDPDKYVREYFDGYIVIDFNQGLKEDFSAEDGLLAREWLEKYPFIYQECFDSIANQKSNHFGEWYLATLLYDQFGLFSLIEKAESPDRHPVKFQILQDIIGCDTATFLSKCNKRENGDCGFPIGSTQCPDLLVYDPSNPKDYCFIEVKTVTKKSKDVMKKERNQDNYFPYLKRLLCKPMYLAVVNSNARGTEKGTGCFIKGL